MSKIWRLNQLLLLCGSIVVVSMGHSGLIDRNLRAFPTMNGECAELSQEDKNKVEAMIQEMGKNTEMTQYEFQGYLQQYGVTRQQLNCYQEGPEDALEHDVGLIQMGPDCPEGVELSEEQVMKVQGLQKEIRDLGRELNKAQFQALLQENGLTQKQARCHSSSSAAGITSSGDQHNDPLDQKSRLGQQCPQIFQISSEDKQKLQALSQKIATMKSTEFSKYKLDALLEEFMLTKKQVLCYSSIGKKRPESQKVPECPKGVELTNDEQWKAREMLQLVAAIDGAMYTAEKQQELLQQFGLTRQQAKCAINRSQQAPMIPIDLMGTGCAQGVEWSQNDRKKLDALTTEMEGNEGLYTQEKFDALLTKYGLTKNQVFCYQFGPMGFKGGLRNILPYRNQDDSKRLSIVELKKMEGLIKKMRAIEGKQGDKLAATAEEEFLRKLEQSGLTRQQLQFFDIAVSDLPGGIHQQNQGVEQKLKQGSREQDEDHQEMTQKGNSAHLSLMQCPQSVSQYSLRQYNAFLQSQVHNGDFSQEMIRGPWRISRSLSAWQIKTNAEIGIGNVYNTRWGGSVIVAQLDVNENEEYTMPLNLSPGTHVATFDWAARSYVDLQSSTIEVKWDGQCLGKLTASDYSIHQTSFILETEGGNSKLTIAGAGFSDSLGATFTNLKVLKLDESIVRNGNFGYLFADTLRSNLVASNDQRSIALEVEAGITDITAKIAQNAQSYLLTFDHTLKQGAEAQSSWITILANDIYLSDVALAAGDTKRFVAKFDGKKEKNRVAFKIYRKAMADIKISNLMVKQLL